MPKKKTKVINPEIYVEKIQAFARANLKLIRKNESYTTKFNLQRPPTDIQQQNQLADELITWAYKPDSFAIVDFPLSLKINPSRFYKMANHNPYFKEALQLSKYKIASRLLQCWRDGELDKTYVLEMLPLYDMEYKTLKNEKFVLAKNALSGAIFNVVQEKVPNSDLVPKLSKTTQGSE